MKTTIIHQNPKNDKLILLFSGWSTDCEFYRNIEVSGWDTAVVTDYTNFDFDYGFLSRYSTVYVYAWSLGVAMASKVLKQDDITFSYAVNGTPFPVNDEYGIPTDIFSGTAENLNEMTLKKFQKRMAGSRTNISVMNDLLSGKYNLTSLKSELLFILNHKDSFKDNFKWDRAYIGKKDRIFPYFNQRDAWKRSEYRPLIIETDDDHFINLKEIVYSTLHDTDNVSKSFTEAFKSYDESASAQKKIVERLFSRISETPIKAKPYILEIGSGTGLLTKKYLEFLDVSHVDTVDIMDYSPAGNTETLSHHCADAEKWIVETDKRWDLILSSSTIQWFANPALFFRNISGRLSEGGTVHISMFIAGNLKELDDIRPCPINYMTRTEIEKILSENFLNFKTEEEEIILNFNSGREALLHLKRTGVSGGHHKNIFHLSDFSNLKQLTYKVLYLCADNIPAKES